MYFDILIVLLLYSTILTLPEEISLIWSRKFTAASFLYLMSRYCGILQLAAAFIHIIGEGSLLVSGSVPK